jgi:hypothetical protein
VKRRTEEILAEHNSSLITLRRAASRYFRSRTAGKAYKRDPAIKIMIRAADSPHMLVIRPAVKKGWARFNERLVTIDPDRIELVLSRQYMSLRGGIVLDPKLSIEVRPDDTVSIGRRCLQTSDGDMQIACDTVARFIENPQAALAASGNYCAFCRKHLTDPQSRARGIGPECFGNYGDFLRYLKPAGDTDEPQRLAETAAPEKPPAPKTLTSEAWEKVAGVLRELVDAGDVNPATERIEAALSERYPDWRTKFYAVSPAASPTREPHRFLLCHLAIYSRVCRL